MLQDITHGRSQIRHERDHAEEQNHDDDGNGVVLFLFHNDSFFRYRIATIFLL